MLYMCIAFADNLQNTPHYIKATSGPVSYQALPQPERKQEKSIKLNTSREANTISIHFRKKNQNQKSRMFHSRNLHNAIQFKPKRMQTIELCYRSPSSGVVLPVNGSRPCTEEASYGRCGGQEMPLEKSREGAFNRQYLFANAYERCILGADASACSGKKRRGRTETLVITVVNLF